MHPPVLHAERLALHPLTIAFASNDYLAWLNDPEVLRYRDTKRTMNWNEMVVWIEHQPHDSQRFAIMVGDRHIGNISLDGIDEETADLGIMLGAKDIWGKGYGSEAIERLTRYGFEDLKLRRITASSPNPSFNAIMRKLGWEHVGSSINAFTKCTSPIDIERWVKLR